MRGRRWLAVVLIVVAPACGRSPSEVGAESPFTPARWPAAELDRALRLQSVSPEDAPAVLAGTATTNTAMVAATADPLAVHAGIEALRSGGSAADAAVTTALAQIALDVGGGTSYAGLMTALYYEAESSQVHSLNAAYTIPSTFNRAERESAQRRLAVMVPGFFAGAQELHRRFGRLSWSSLFGPAIWIADHGVPVGPGLFVGVQGTLSTIQRSPTAARVLLKPNRQPYEFGELFRQPDLASTLSEIAVLGTDHVYGGRWARHFIEAARASGADISADDLRSYRAVWMPPLRVQHGEYEVFALPPPNAGGSDILSALKLVEAARLAAARPASASADTLYSLVQISRLQRILAFTPPASLASSFPHVDLSSTSRLRIETAEALMSRMHAPDWLEISRELLHKTVTTSHTAAVIAVDSRGNIAVVLHSCNCYGWGTAALFVDGVSIPEVAGATPATAQTILRGARLPDFSAPILVLRQQRPALAAADTGSSLPELMLQNVVNILDWGMDPHEALEQPHYYGPSYEPDERRPGALALDREVVHEGEFLPAILDELSSRGQPLSLVPRMRAMAAAGVWIGIRFDTSPRRLIGAVPAAFRAHLEGF